MSDSFGRISRTDARHSHLDYGSEYRCPPRGLQEMETIYRPSHADFTYQAKYGIETGRRQARIGP